MFSLHALLPFSVVFLYFQIKGVPAKTFSYRPCLLYIMFKLSQDVFPSLTFVWHVIETSIYKVRPFSSFALRFFWFSSWCSILHGSCTCAQLLLEKGREVISLKAVLLSVSVLKLNHSNLLKWFMKYIKVLLAFHFVSLGGGRGVGKTHSAVYCSMLNK